MTCSDYGICKHQTATNNLCLLDVDADKKPCKCDLQKNADGTFECHQGKFSCERCYWFPDCQHV